MSQVGSSGPGTDNTFFLLFSKEAVNSPEIAFTTEIQSGRSVFFAVLSNVTVGGVGVDVLLEYSVDGGATYLAVGYQSGLFVQDYNSGVVTNSNTTTSFIIGTLDNSVADSGYSGVVWMFSLPSAKVKYINSMGTGVVSGTDENQQGSGLLMTAFPVNAIRFRPSSGNFVGGTFDLFGV